MSLFTHTVGQGRDLVLLHGWGMNADVWEGIVPSLANDFRVTVIDLPGHGRSVDPVGEYSLVGLAAQVLDVIPHHAILVGWSLGGMVATQLALDNPGHLNQLVLVASAPQFIRDDSWPNGIEPAVLDGFAGDLRNGFQQTVKRFIAIQSLGSEHARQQQHALRERVFRHGNPQVSALEGGLRLLQDTDLRPRLNELDLPVLLLVGQYDTLFRPAAAQQTLKLIPHAHLEIIPGAGHAPFISHPDVFLEKLTTFCNG